MKIDNEIKILNKSDIPKLLKMANKDWDVYVPIRNSNGDVYFDVLSKDESDAAKLLDKLSIENADTVLSPKDVFFPQMEVLFNIKNNEFYENIDSSSKLIFGIRSCDLKAILFTDEFFKRNYEDIYYLSKIKDRLLISIGCLTPPRPDSCFCTSSGTGPFLEDGYDIQLVDTGKFYYAEVGSKAGKKFVEKYSAFFMDPDDNSSKGTGSKDSYRDEIEKIKQKARESVTLKVNFDKAIELMKDDNFFPRENYERIGERCIYCGACLYTCPTCTCFSITDTVNGDKEGIRFRNWDGCIFEGYTREASGHNPRIEKYLRTARRYEHKLKYDYKITGTSGCVGCGRCLESCPVNIGMSKFILEITEGKKIL